MILTGNRIDISAINFYVYKISLGEKSAKQ